MIDRIKKMFAPNPLIITFPFESRNCAVTQFLELKKRFYSNLLKITASNFLNNFYEYFDGRLSIYLTDKILIYGHSSKNTEYIVSEGNNLIDYNWFIHRGARNYNLVYGHICKGANILTREEWKLIFTDWVSYNEDVYQYLGTKKAQNVNKKLHKEIYSAVKNQSDAMMAKNIISDTYSNLISGLYDSYDPRMGDVITMLNLINSRDSLEFYKRKR